MRCGEMVSRLPVKQELEVRLLPPQPAAKGAMVKQDHATPARSSPGCESRSLHEDDSRPHRLAAGCRPFKPEAGVQVPVGLPKRKERVL